MTTIVRAAFTHHAAHALFRAREAKQYRGTVDVAITEVTGDQLPVALSIRGKGQNMGPLHLRHDGERFYRPLLSPAGEPMSAEAFKLLLIDPVMMQDDAPYWPDFPFPRGPATRLDAPLGRMWDNPLSLRTLDETFHLGSLVFSDVAEMAAKTEQIARDLRNIDGTIHLPCGEPVWRLNAESGEIDVMLSTDPMYLQPQLMMEFFRLDHADRISGILARVGVGATWRTLPTDVRISDPDSLAFDPTGVAVAKLYASTLPLLRALGQTRGPAFEAARAQLERYDLDVYEGIPGAGVDGLQVLVDLVATTSMDTPETDRMRAIDGHLVRISAAVVEDYVIPLMEPEPGAAPGM